MPNCGCWTGALAIDCVELGVYTPEKLFVLSLVLSPSLIFLRLPGVERAEERSEPQGRHASPGYRWVLIYAAGLSAGSFVLACIMVVMRQVR